MIKWKCICTHSGDLDDLGLCFFRESVLPHGNMKYAYVQAPRWPGSCQVIAWRGIRWLLVFVAVNHFNGRKYVHVVWSRFAVQRGGSYFSLHVDALF